MGKLRWKLRVRDSDRTRVEQCLKIFLILTILAPIVAFNIAPQATYVGSLPQKGSAMDKESYFGYSVGILKNDLDTWLVVGAPKANSTGSPNIFEPGALFKCPVHNEYGEKCTEIILDVTQNFLAHTELRWSIPFRDEGWTGAALDIDTDGNVVVCAPRWKNTFRRVKLDTLILNEYSINGLCYLIEKDLESRSALPFSPMLDIRKQIRRYHGDGLYEFAHGQSGYDVHFTKNNELLLGSPGVLNWQGSVAKYVRSKRTLYEEKVVPNPYYTENIRDFSYFGYSITSGKFDMVYDLYYVAGAPRASGFGKVFVFLMRKLSSQKMYIYQTKEGVQMGEYFGSSVAAPDFNGDGFNDLVVGAPMHSVEDLFDVGCIYVFMNNDRESGQLAVAGAQLFGDIQGRARFGTSLGTPGDLDRDGYEDLVVGAPYENEGKGAVYIFMGSITGIREHFSQKLSPEEVHPTGFLRGFGISFSKPYDVDSNSYPDFAVGAYLSDDVVLMQTRPVIKAKGEILSEPKKLSLSSKYFIALPCIEYEGDGVPLETEFEVRVTVQQESVSGEILASFRNTGATETMIDIRGSKNERKCVDLNVALKLDRSDAKAITMRMEFALKDEEFGPGTPILSPYTEPPPPLLLSFITECPDDFCSSNLRTFAKFEGFDPKGIFKIGLAEKLTMHVEVTNRKDPAYLPSLTINVPKPILVLSTLQDCSVTLLPLQYEVVCHLANPLRKTEKSVVVLDLDVTKLDDTSPEIKINLHANSSADEELEPDDNEFDLSLRVRKEASLKVTGWSNPEQFHYERKRENELKTNDTVQIQHVFSIEKSEITPLREVSIKVTIPTLFTSPKGDKLRLLQITENEMTFHGKSHSCQQQKESMEDKNDVPETEEEEHEMSFNEYPSDAETVLLSTWDCSHENINCTTIVCDIGPWKKAFDVASLTISFQLNFTELAHIIPVKDGFTVSSFLEVEIPNAKFNKIRGQTYDNATVQTIFFPGSLPAQPIQYWIYLLAALGGLLLLIIIAFILYKVGFFKRKKYEQLQAQQARVTSQEEPDQQQ